MQLALLYYNTDICQEQDLSVLVMHQAVTLSEGTGGETNLTVQNRKQFDMLALNVWVSEGVP